MTMTSAGVDRRVPGVLFPAISGSSLGTDHRIAGHLGGNRSAGRDEMDLRLSGEYVGRDSASAVGEFGYDEVVHSGEPNIVNNFFHELHRHG